MHTPEQTIVALSTPPGRGGIAILRLSGPEALACAAKLFRMRGSGHITPGYTHLGEIVSPDGLRQLDRAFLTHHPAGRSYTGEEVVELSCHGSPPLVEEILGLLVESGARPAVAGEFTYRAMLNGRMDLTQAEGVRDLINAPTSGAARAAMSQVRGDLSRCVTSMRDELIEIISRLEAALEFAEEPDVSASKDVNGTRLGMLRAEVERFVATYRRGRLLREGACVALAGRPNAGKSSLFNRLLRSERAIVSSEAGTTRDYISERIDLDGIPVTLVDTAGLRDNAGGVEALGVERAQRILDMADLILLLCPCDEEPDSRDERLLHEDPARAILLASKSDLLEREPPDWAAGALPVSATTGDGVAELRAAIVSRLAMSPALSSEELLICDARHHAALTSCSDHLSRASWALDRDAEEEIALVDLYAALRDLGEITGAVSIEQIHERIFSTFCIGK